MSSDTRKSSSQVSYPLRSNLPNCAEKRKIIRKLDKIATKLETEPTHEESLQKQKKFKDDLTYINHFPPLWKYLSLFPKEETEESKAVREETYAKVLKMASFKRDIRDRELWDADVKIEDEKVVNAASGSVKIEKDAFFESDSEDVDAESDEEAFKFVPAPVEKRPVMRDGRVPKMAKNYEKLQKEKIEKQRIKEGWYDDVPVVAPKTVYVDKSTLDKKPLKIKASSFGKDVAQEIARNKETAAPAGKLNF